MSNEEKINKTVSSIKQVTFGRVDEEWIDAFKEGMRVALEAEEIERKLQTCKSCNFCNEDHGLQPDGIGWQTLECELRDGTFDISPVYNDGFGCNKWEEK
jgi:hypothetical protein